MFDCGYKVGALSPADRSRRGQLRRVGAPGCCWSDDGPWSALLLSSVWCLKPFYPSPRLRSLNILVFSCFITSIIDPWYCADLTKSSSQRLDRTCLHCGGLNSNQASDGADLIMHQCWVQGRGRGPLGPGKWHRDPEPQLVPCSAECGVWGHSLYLNGRSLLCLSSPRATDVTRT